MKSARFPLPREWRMRAVCCRHARESGHPVLLAEQRNPQIEHYRSIPRSQRRRLLRFHGSRGEPQSMKMMLVQFFFGEFLMPVAAQHAIRAASPLGQGGTLGGFPKWKPTPPGTPLPLLLRAVEGILQETESRVLAEACAGAPAPPGASDDRCGRPAGDCYSDPYS